MPHCRNRRQFAPFLLIVVLHALPAQAAGQSPASAAWKQLSDAEAGSAFKVALSDGATLTAHLVGVEGDLVVLNQIQTSSAAVSFRMRAFRRGQLTLNRSEIASVELLSTPAFEAPEASSFDQLSGLLRSGERITVADSNGKSFSGVVTSLSPAGITVRVGQQPREFLERDVVAIRKREGDSLLNGTLIGLGVGAGVAAISCAPYAYSYGFCMLIASPGIGVSVGIGVAIDALVRREIVLFQRRKTSGRMTVAPQFGATRKGVVLSFGF